MTFRPCGVCGVPVRDGRCPTHPRTRAPRHDAPKWSGAWPVLRAAVLRRDRHTCRYCGAHATTADHVVAGIGVDYMLSVPALAVAACRSCNSSKRDVDLVHWAASSRAPAGARVVLDELRTLITDAERWLQQHSA